MGKPWNSPLSLDGFRSFTLCFARKVWRVACTHLWRCLHWLHRQDVDALLQRLQVGQFEQPLWLLARVQASGVLLCVASVAGHEAERLGVRSQQLNHLHECPRRACLERRKRTTKTLSTQLSCNRSNSTQLKSNQNQQVSKQGETMAIFN
jgi:aminoglycoside phosphotransferase